MNRERTFRHSAMIFISKDGITIDTETVVCLKDFDEVVAGIIKEHFSEGEAP